MGVAGPNVEPGNPCVWGGEEGKEKEGREEEELEEGVATFTTLNFRLLYKSSYSHLQYWCTHVSLKDQVIWIIHLGAWQVDPHQALEAAHNNFVCRANIT